MRKPFRVTPSILLASVGLRVNKSAVKSRLSLDPTEPQVSAGLQATVEPLTLAA